jgi:hypothetical protein
MTQQTIGIGSSPNDGTGDTARVAFNKVNGNFNELYYQITTGETNAGLTIVNAQYPPGNVLRYGNNTVPGTTDMLPAFNAAHNSSGAAPTWLGPNITIPAGTYFLNGTWEIRREVHVFGAGCGSEIGASTTSLTFPSNTTGIRLFSNRETGESSNNSAHSTFQNIHLQAQSKASTGHGIHSRARAYFHSVRVDGFKEDGFHFYGDSATSAGDCNQWMMSFCDANDNGGHGFFVQGADSNAGLCIGCNFKSNGGWGIYDNSFLGNTYYSAHLNDNAIGSIKSKGSSNASTFHHPYIEAYGAFGAEIDPPAMFFGGMPIGYPYITISGDGSGATAVAFINNGGVQSVYITNQGSGYTTASASISYHGSGSGATLNTPTISGGKITSITVSAAGSGYEGAQNFGALVQTGTQGGMQTNDFYVNKRRDSVRYGTMRFCDAKDAFITLSHVGVSNNLTFLKWNDGEKTFTCTVNNTDSGGQVGAHIQVDPSISTFTGGRASAPQASSWLFPNGVWLGGANLPGNSRMLQAASAMPSSGGYAQGDFIFNTGPSLAGSPLILHGWHRLTTGTSHTLGTDWAACYIRTDDDAIGTLANSATPSVSKGDRWLTGGTTTITNFTNGQTGQIIRILSEHAITITDGTNIFLAGSTNFVMANTDSLTLIQKADGKWYELGRSVN